MKSLVRLVLFALPLTPVFSAFASAPGLVLTPEGYRPASEVVHLQAGQTVRQVSGQLVVVDPESDRVVHQFDSKSHPWLASGWIADAFWQIPTGDSVSSFTTTWKVPAAPTTQSGQTIFYFNGICNAGTNTILQPVLQWGSSAAGGGNYWSIASWYVSATGSAYTGLIQVNPGDTLVGVMKLTGQGSAGFSYTSEFEGISGTSLPAQNVDELVWNNETLEAYGITQCSDYPTDTLEYTDIALQTTAGTSKVNWTLQNRFTDCGQHATLAGNGEIDIATH